MPEGAASPLRVFPCVFYGDDMDKIVEKYSDVIHKKKINGKWETTIIKVDDFPETPKKRSSNKRKKQNKKKHFKKSGDSFYSSHEWAKIRYKVLKRSNGRCELCGRSSADGVKLHVDHIKPRHRYPHLSLDINNLQVLCQTCNWGKYGEDETDWRGKTPLPE